MKYFAPFSFNEADRKLWREGRPVPITRKAADVLACLLDHAGTTVAHQVLMRTVWPDTHVQPDNVKILVHELRLALGDDPAQAAFIKSDPGRGYVFARSVANATCLLCAPLNAGRESAIVRSPELAALEDAVARAATRGEPRYVVLEGLPGAGKTALCRATIDRAWHWPQLRTACASAPHLSGAAEPYGIILELLDRIVQRYPTMAQPILSRRAPSWLPFLPSFGHSADRLADIADHAPRLARELAGALEEMARDSPLLLVLEDLHWAAPDTIDLLAAIAEDPASSQLIVIATVAPLVDSPARQALDRLTRHLKARASSSLIRLEPWSAGQVLEYLTARFGGECAVVVADSIYRATLGHAAFVTAAADALGESGFLRQALFGWRLSGPVRALDGIIDQALGGSVQELVDQLNPADRALLEAAAATGRRFSAREVAELLGLDSLEPVRRRLDAISLHLPSIEPVPPGRGRQTAGWHWFQFRQPALFDRLRADAPLVAHLGPRRRASSETTLRRA